MAERYSVYCKQSAARLTPAELLEGIEAADLHTIAECYELEDDIILPALDSLRVDTLESEQFRRYQLCYRPDGFRQIYIERWQTAEEVQTAVSEVLDELKGEQEEQSISSHLQDVVDVIDISFGSAEGEAMAPVLASEAARWLAEKFQGIIRDPDGAWWQLGEHNEYLQIVNMRR